ncbi:MAG: uracil-DNA glycosylase [Spirochaetaceae bacterium]|jgi:DNA polymerase|nr:uracil-DNA glycosylase [Spirochaetaceae bacterium]
MTGTQKNAIARFFDAAAAALSTGCRAARAVYDFKDDAAPAEAQAALEKIAAEVRACRACKLCEERRNAVPGEGVRRPLVLVVGEGPGADEDASGRPFVGPAGKLLDQMLSSIGLSRDKNCFIANIVKCRPPENREPEANETSRCVGYLERQTDALRPLVIVSTGRTSTGTLLHMGGGIRRLRGSWKTYRGIPLLPTFHPSYLLRDPDQKRLAWEDMKSLCRRLAELDPAYRAQTAALRAGRNI